MKKDFKLVTLLETKLPGMIPVFKAHGYSFTGFNWNKTSRPELQGAPKFAELVGPMWGGDGNLRYETPEAYADISADIS